MLWGAVGTQGLAVKDGGDPPSGHVRDGVGTAHGTKLEPGQEQMGELVGDGEWPMRPTVPVLSPLGRPGILGDKGSFGTGQCKGGGGAQQSSWGGALVSLKYL